MENPIEMDDLGVPLFSETSIYWLVVSTPSEKIFVKMGHLPQIGDEILPSYGDYFINYEITIPITLPETNSSPLKIGHIYPNRKYIRSNHQFFQGPCLFQGGYVPFCGFETSYLPDIAAFK